MNVNDIFSDITSFWESIYPIIVFHVIFFIVYRFTFSKISIKASIENYLAGDNFKKTKSILEQFELWKKLPFILLVFSLIYLALFNSATNLVSSIRIFPFTFTYSTDEFIHEYNPKIYLIEIAKYGDSPHIMSHEFDYYKTNRIKEKYQEEYKVKYPELYKSSVGYAQESAASRIRYYYLLLCLVIALLFSYLKYIKSKKTDKLKVTFKFMFVLILVVPAYIILRYQAEQKVEQKFISEVVFVRTALTTDITQKPIWTDMQLDKALNQVGQESELIRRLNSRRYLFWLSRKVEQSAILEEILGNRLLHSEIIYK